VSERREQLKAALEPGLAGEVLIREAARERLAQLPEKCDCWSEAPIMDRVTGEWTRSLVPIADHSRCHGRGTVYPKALVEKGMASLVNIGVDANDATLYRYVVAVLDFINDWKPE
jgi:hypothetical protein